jgi:hypothetical protein
MGARADRDSDKVTDRLTDREYTDTLGHEHRQIYMHEHGNGERRLNLNPSNMFALFSDKF